jgi:hypothetical protein
VFAAGLPPSAPARWTRFFASFVQRRVDALIVAAEAFFASYRDRLVALSTRHAIPTVVPVLLQCMSPQLAHL